MDKQSITYLNTASSGLISKQSLANTYSYYEAMQTNASTRAEEWRNNEWQPIRETLAKFMDAPVFNVAFIPNFSYALTAIVHSMMGTERVLLYKQDYPSLLDAFRLNDFNITWVDSEDGFEIPAQRIKDILLAEKIDVLAISHVQWDSGFKIDIHDLSAFCRQHDIIFIVDATQSMGAVEISARKLDADAIITSNYKWMNAGHGCGVMYVADRLLEKYTPKIGGFNSYRPVGDKMVYEASIRSYEPGHLNLSGLLLLDAAMKEKLVIGLRNIEEHNRKLTEILLTDLEELPVHLIGAPTVENRSSIVIIKDENGLGQFLVDNRVVVTHRGGNLRISAHFYTTETDIKRLVSCLKQFYGVAIHDN